MIGMITTGLSTNKIQVKVILIIYALNVKMMMINIKNMNSQFNKLQQYVMEWQLKIVTIIRMINVLVKVKWIIAVQ